MKSGCRGLTGPTVGGDCLRVYHAIVFDNKWLLKSRPKMIVTIPCVIKLHGFAACCNHPDLQTVSKGGPRSFNNGDRYDLSAINTRHRLVSCAGSPTPVRTRSHL